MSEPEIEILYEEGPCLVVNKPSGLLTQSPPGIDNLVSRIKRFLIIRENKPGGAYLGITHRLDRPASGVMVFTKHVRAARRLSEQFEKRSVTKIYWALVEGPVDPPEGTWTDHIRKVPDEARSEIVDADHPDARLAVLHYKTLETGPDRTWLEITLETGRTHQIRIQAASRGNPIVGDAQYGATVTFGPQYEDQRLRAIALHARSLSFEHPMTREPVTVTAPTPQSWEGVQGS